MDKTVEYTAEGPLTMNLYQAKEYAKRNGFNGSKFIALFPSGPQVCEWIDAYFGLFRIEAIGAGFFTVGDVDKEFPSLVCMTLPDEARAALSDSTSTGEM